jgi:hypothetical protein
MAEAGAQRPSMSPGIWFCPGNGYVIKTKINPTKAWT